MSGFNHSYACSFARRVVFAFAGVVFLFPSPASVLAAETPSAVSAREADLKTVIIPVEGMACIACAATVRRAIKSLDGVSHVEVSLEKRTAQVTYAAGKLSPDRIVAAVNKLGYRAGTPREVE